MMYIQENRESIYEINIFLTIKYCIKIDEREYI